MASQHRAAIRSRPVQAIRCHGRLVVTQPTSVPAQDEMIKAMGKTPE
jgi:hypothetical protein